MLWAVTKQPTATVLYCRLVVPNPSPGIILTLHILNVSPIRHLIQLISSLVETSRPEMVLSD